MKVGSVRIARRHRLSPRCCASWKRPRESDLNFGPDSRGLDRHWHALAAERVEQSAVPMMARPCAQLSNPAVVARQGCNPVLNPGRRGVGLIRLAV